MRFTLNLRPATLIEHPWQLELVVTFPNASVETTSSHPKLQTSNLNLPTQALEIKECEAPESKSTHTFWPNITHISCIRLPNRFAFVLVRANTLPATLGLSIEGNCGRGFATVFLLGHLSAKWPIWSHTKHFRSPTLAPTFLVSLGQPLFKCSPPHWKHFNPCDKVCGRL